MKKSLGSVKRADQSLLCFPLPATYIIVLLMMHVRLAINNKGIHLKKRINEKKMKKKGKGKELHSNAHKKVDWFCRS